MKWFLIAAGCLGLLIAGCEPINACEPSEMGLAGNLNPSNYTIVGLNPTLTWEYPSSTPSPYPYPTGSTECDITGYQVYLAPFFDQYNDLGGTTSGVSTSFNPSTLAPGTLYFWEVRVLSAAGAGPWTGKHAFVTGPLCEVASLPAPYAFAPMGTINTLNPAFIWFANYGSQFGCVPSGYHLELSLDPSFGSLEATFDSNNDPIYSWQGWTPDFDLLNCTDYYWRVAAVKDSIIGPYADREFRTQVGLCLIPIYFIPRLDANCRIGPNVLYGRGLVLEPGQQYPVMGRHLLEDETWYLLDLSNLPNLPGINQCWVRDVTGNIPDGDPEYIPLSDDFPPLVIEQPGGDDEGGGEGPSCAGLNQNACDSTPGCSFDIRSKTCVGN